MSNLTKVPYRIRNANIDKNFDVLRAKIEDYKKDLNTANTELDVLRAATVPPGFVMAYASSNTPTGWLSCKGQEEWITSYPELYAVLGVLYGGDGITTFGIPDMRQRTIVGYDASGGAAYNNISETGVGGEEAVTLDVTTMPSHSHYIYEAAEHSNRVPATGGGSFQGYMWNGAASTVYQSETLGGTAGNDGSHENLQPYMTQHWCIKT